ncbi:MAG: CRISPR-associated RAMP protein Csx10, partial [Symploca sp. SIO2B6]|nr:CRISPR-associated RAMP protein Csx10 [Symploca sp. SIO2B6]
MKRLHLKITAKSPLAIGERKPGSVSEAMDYIPGSVIRGAIAQKILQHGGSQQPEPGDDFHKLFVDDRAAIFRNTYPAIAKTGEDTYQESTNPIHLLPATALSYKTESGFCSDNIDSKKAGVFDALIDSFCAREQGLFYEPNDLNG